MVVCHQIEKKFYTRIEESRLSFTTPARGILFRLKFYKLYLFIILSSAMNPLLSSFLVVIAGGKCFFIKILAKLRHRIFRFCALFLFKKPPNLSLRFY